MSQRSKITTAQSLKGQIYLGIVPQKIKQINANPAQSTNKWVLYLQKGMQIIGKTPIFEILEQEQKQYKFDAQKNRFDFQIATQKNYTYTWSLYSIDDQEYQERISSQNFNIKEYYIKYQTQCNRTGYDLKVTLKKNYILDFKLFIQNTANNIMGLTNWVVPQAQEQVAKALVSLVKKGSQPNGIRKQKQSNIFTQEDKDAKKAKQLEPIQKGAEQQLQHTNKNQAGDSINQKSKQSKIKIKQLPNPIKIQQQSQQQSSILSDKNKIQKKVSIPDSHPQSPMLQQIIQDKQKQDFVTPMAKDSVFKKPGDIKSAIAQVVYGIEQYHQEQPVEKVQQQGQQGLKYETPTGEQGQTQQNNETKTEKIYNIDQVPQFQHIPIDSGNKFKKVIIVVLILILLAGIIGALISPKDNDEKVIKNKPKKKILKKGKNV